MSIDVRKLRPFWQEAFSLDFLSSSSPEKNKRMNQLTLEKLMLLSIFSLILVGLLNSLFILSDNNVALAVFGLYSIFKGNRLVLLTVSERRMRDCFRDN
jgi:hypothetical protein